MKTEDAERVRLEIASRILAGMTGGPRDLPNEELHRLAAQALRLADALLSEHTKTWE